jgi:hypothetical protein
MKILFVIALASMMIMVAGYGVVKSIDNAFDEPSFQAEASKITNATSVDESEHVECTLNVSERDLVGGVPPVYDRGGKIRLGGISFFTSLDSGLEEAKSTEMSLFLYLHSMSCGWCKKFEAELLCQWQ